MKQVNYKINIDTSASTQNVDKLNKDLETTNKEIENVSKSSKGFGKSLDKLGISMKTLGIGAVVGGITAIGGVFVSAMKKGAEFSKELSGLKAVLGASNQDMESLSNSAKELGASTQFTAKQVVGLQTELAKLGFTTEEILDATGATLDLAASLGVGLSEAASITGSTLRAFGLETTETQRLVDVMALSTSKSALDYDSLRESLKLVAPTARAMNVDIEETTSLLAVLADNGLKGSVAGTGLSKTFIELNKKGIPLNEALQKVKNSSNQLNTAIDLVGVVGSKALLTLANNAPKIDKLNTAFDGASGSAKKLAETRLDNLAGDTTKLGSAWEGFLLSIEDGTGIFNSIARGIVQAGTSLLGFLTPAESLSEQFFKQKKQVEELETKLNPLVDRYDELANKSKLSKEEQQELDNVIIQISDDIPLAVTEFDEYGKALGINTDAAREFILESKEILKLKNKEAIEEETDAIENLTSKLNTQALQLQKINGAYAKKTFTVTKLGNEIETITKLTNEEVLSIKNKRAELNLEIKTRQAIIAQLKGEKTEAEKAKEAAEELAEIEIEQTKSLIAIQKELLEQAEKLPETTERELVIKNRKIKAINEEIKRLKDLGLQEIKQTKQSTDNFEKVKIRGAEEIQITQQLRDVEIQSLEDRAHAQTMYYESLDEQRQKDLIRERANQEAKVKMANDALGAINALVQAFAKEDEESAKRAFNVNKAIGIAQAIMSTAQGVINAYANPVDVASGVAFAKSAIIAATGAAQVAVIAKTKFESPNAPSTSTPSAPSGGFNGETGATTQPPAFNVVGQSGFNQVATALGEQPPIKTFVVSQDVTTAQQLNNAIVQTAKF